MKYVVKDTKCMMELNKTVKYLSDKYGPPVIFACRKPRFLKAGMKASGEYILPVRREEI